MDGFRSELKPPFLPGQLYLVGIDVDGDYPLAGEGELDGVAADPAKPVHDQVTLTPKYIKTKALQM